MDDIENVAPEATETVTAEVVAVVKPDEKAALAAVVADDAAFFIRELPKLAAWGFDHVRQLFRKSIRDSKAYSRFLSETALINFTNHGNTNQINDHFYDLRHDGKNFTRPAAYVKWATKFAGLKLENNKLVKDTARADMFGEEGKPTARALALLDEARAIPYWEFAPDKELTKFMSADVIKEMKRVIAKFGGKRFVPKDEATRQLLLLAGIKVAEMERTISLADVIAATQGKEVVTETVTVPAATLAA